MTVAAESPRTVLSRIEQSLREIWEKEETPGQIPRARACTMNLVVVAGSEEIAERYVSVVDEVTGSIPARAIVVTLAREAPEATLSGDVCAVSPGDGSLGTASERIRLMACGAMADRVGSAVYSLLVPELPTVLVWLGRIHVADPLFVDLAKECQRIVLDTEYTSLASLFQVARWAREERGRPEVADLAWTRLAPWQEMCARFFDEPSLRSHAFHIRSLEIAQACESGAALGSEGALLLSWFATRLGWRMVEGGDSLRFLRPDGGTVSVKLSAIPRPQGVAPAALAQIRLVAEHDGLVSRGNLVRRLASGPTKPVAEDAPPASQGRRGPTVDADVLVWHLDVPVPSATEQFVRLGNNRGARLLERTLHRSPVDPVLNESVAFAEQLIDERTICR